MAVANSNEFKVNRNDSTDNGCDDSDRRHPIKIVKESQHRLKGKAKTVYQFARERHIL